MLTYSWIKLIDMPPLLYPCVGPESKFFDPVTRSSCVVNWCVSCRTVLYIHRTLSYTKYYTSLEEWFRQLENVLRYSEKHTSRTTSPNTNHKYGLGIEPGTWVSVVKGRLLTPGILHVINTLDIDLSLC